MYFIVIQGFGVVRRVAEPRNTVLLIWATSNSSSIDATQVFGLPSEIYQGHM